MDMEYTMNPDACRSSCGQVFINGTPITFCSVTKKFVMLSMTETERAAGIIVAQAMIYLYLLLALLEIKVELSMLFKIDNFEEVYIANS